MSPISSKKKLFFGNYFLTLGLLLSSKKKRIWIREWLSRRKELGCYENLMRELALEDAEGYRRWLRMDTATFEYILEKVSPLITRKNTVFREAISAGERLAITLRYLATGETQSSLMYQFRVGQNTISGIIPLVCSAIYSTLKDEYLVVPSTEEEWKEVASKFWYKWNFPMCIGALDGKHVRIAPPPRSGSTFYNYKKDFSIVLMAVADADLKFLYVDVGTNGRVSDGGVWGKCGLKQALDRNDLKIPEASQLPGTNINVPHVLVADDAFPLTPHIMKPYPGKSLEKPKAIFNYRLSRARRCIENAFGALVSKFQVYSTRINASPLNCRKIVLATVVLHNLLREQTIEDDSVELMERNPKKIYEGQHRGALVPFARLRQKPSCHGKEIRDRLCAFFNGTGAVRWQDDVCFFH